MHQQVPLLHPVQWKSNRALVTLSRLWTECLQRVLQELPRVVPLLSSLFLLLGRCRKGGREVRGMGTCSCQAIALNPGQRHQGSTSSTSLRLRLQKVQVRPTYLSMPRTITNMAKMCRKPALCVCDATRCCSSFIFRGSDIISLKKTHTVPSPFHLPQQSLVKQHKTRDAHERR